MPEGVVTIAGLSSVEGSTLCGSYWSWLCVLMVGVVVAVMVQVLVGIGARSVCWSASGDDRGTTPK